MITLDLVESAQKKWGEGIVKIGSLKNNFKLCKEFTSSFLNETYSFKEGKILFKPTKACEEQFRPNFDMALSYFIGGNDSFCNEDEGFAMKKFRNIDRNSTPGSDPTKTFVDVDYPFYRLADVYLI